MECHPRYCRNISEDQGLFSVECCNIIKLEVLFPNNRNKGCETETLFKKQVRITKSKIDRTATSNYLMGRYNILSIVLPNPVGIDKMFFLRATGNNQSIKC